MLMAENARTGFVWDTLMKNLEAQRGMLNAGLKVKTGDAVYTHAVTHLPEDQGDKPYELILVELKGKGGAAKADAAKPTAKTEKK